MQLVWNCKFRNSAVIRSFIIVGRGPAYSEPQRWDLQLNSLHQYNCIKCVKIHQETRELVQMQWHIFTAHSVHKIWIMVMLSVITVSTVMPPRYCF